MAAPAARIQPGKAGPIEATRKRAELVSGAVAGSLRCMIRLLAMFVFLLACAGAQAAQLGVGSTREEVVAALGEPVGRSSAGSREVLSYSAGRVVLRDGRVEEIDTALVPAAPTPEPPPPPPPPAPVAEPAPAEPAPAPAAPAIPEAPPPADQNWIKLSLMAVFLGVILLLGRHWMRVAKRAQAAKKPDLLSR